MGFFFHRERIPVQTPRYQSKTVWVLYQSHPRLKTLFCCSLSPLLNLRILLL